MRRSWTILGIVLLLFAMTAAAWADPRNANTDTTDLHCDAPVGDITITAVLRSAGLALHVVDSSMVVVIRDGRITVLSTGGSRRDAI
jgi:hypothetical protein